MISTFLSSNTPLCACSTLAATLSLIWVSPFGRPGARKRLLRPTGLVTTLISFALMLDTHARTADAMTDDRREALDSLVANGALINASSIALFIHLIGLVLVMVGLTHEYPAQLPSQYDWCNPGAELTPVARRIDLAHCGVH